MNVNYNYINNFEFYLVDNLSGIYEKLDILWKNTKIAYIMFKYK